MNSFQYKLEKGRRISMGAYSRMYFLFTSRWAYIFFFFGGGEGLISWKVHSVRYLYSIKRVPLTPYIYLNIVPWTVRLGREKKTSVSVPRNNFSASSCAALEISDICGKLTMYQHRLCSEIQKKLVLSHETGRSR